MPQPLKWGLYFGAAHAVFTGLLFARFMQHENDSMISLAWTIDLVPIMIVTAVPQAFGIDPYPASANGQYIFLIVSGTVFYTLVGIALSWLAIRFKLRRILKNERLRSNP